MPRSTMCEVLSGDRWQLMDIEEALPNRGAVEMRCPECKRPVRPHRAGTTGQAAHFEHTEANPDCSLSPGTRTAHLNGRSLG